ncbi:MAG: hypothetical protein ACE5FU_00840 [Nitrospinota bacterium]
MVSRKERLIDSGKLAVEPKFIRHFLPRLFLLTAVLVGTAISVVIWANIWGNYGTKGLFQFYNDRRGKAEALTQIPKEKLADLWIIGSSTIYPLLPKDVESTFNLKAYSLANFWARTEEHWCWLNFILKDLQKKPKLIILSLDTWSFAPDEKGPPNFPHLRRRLLNTPQLIKHLPEYSEFKHFLSKSQDLLTGQQLLRALRKISKGSKRRSVFDLSSVNVFGDGSGPYAEEKPDSYFATEEINSFYKDILYSNKEHDFKENQEKFDSFGSLDIVSLQEITVFFPAKKFRKKSIDLFTKFVQLTQK